MFCLSFMLSIFFRSKIRSFANNNVKRHNSSSTKTYPITLYRHFSHRDKKTTTAQWRLKKSKYTYVHKFNF